MDAALDLIAERGENGLTLRELTDAAEANVSAVSYHFGSLGALCEAAIEDALAHYLDAQQEAVRALPLRLHTRGAGRCLRPTDDARPELGGRDLAVKRIVARSGVDPPRGWDRLGPRFDQIRADCRRVLKANLPDVKDKELDFRTRAVAGMLNWLVLAPIGQELRRTSSQSNSSAC